MHVQPTLHDLPALITDAAGRRWWDFGSRRLPVISGGEGTTGDPAVNPPAGDPPAGDPPAGDPPAGDPPAGDPAAEQIDSLPDWAQNLIRNTRDEAARYRNERNEERTKVQSHADQIKAINKALGIETEEPDPEALQKGIADRDATIRQLQIERAFSQAAKAHDADEELTLAVLLKEKKLAGLDPSAEDFAGQLTGLVESAVKANPKLKATQAAPKSGSAGFNGNNPSPGRTGPVDLGQAIENALNT